MTIKKYVEENLLPAVVRRKTDVSKRPKNIGENLTFKVNGDTSKEAIGAYLVYSGRTIFRNLERVSGLTKELGEFTGEVVNCSPLEGSFTMQNRGTDGDFSASYTSPCYPKIAREIFGEKRIFVSHNYDTEKGAWSKNFEKDYSKGKPSLELNLNRFFTESFIIGYDRTAHGPNDAFITEGSIDSREFAYEKKTGQDYELGKIPGFLAREVTKGNIAPLEKVSEAISAMNDYVVDLGDELSRRHKGAHRFSWNSFMNLFKRRPSESDVYEQPSGVIVDTIEQPREIVDITPGRVGEEY